MTGNPMQLALPNKDYLPKLSYLPPRKICGKIHVSFAQYMNVVDLKLFWRVQ